MDLVGPYCIREAKIDGGSEAAVTTMHRIVHVGAKDYKLEQLARQLQKPIVLHDATLGRLNRERGGAKSQGGEPRTLRGIASSQQSIEPTILLDETRLA